ncbi:hypothetical protein QAD02_012155 [Eretmocerus hayati]|uniref:Uncharacterized protein n=1 Tax=Eretmocerus hayati TaxID=131215 RepID=A0ACC2NZR7_9HYME|nr:hypothetical protein QAD02_012155 [Eretmocerus hayati]
MSRTTFFDSYKYQDRRIGRGLRLGSTNSKVYMATLSRVQRDLILNFESGSFKMAESAFNELPMTLKKKNWLDYWLLVTATKRGHIPLIQFLIRNRCRVRIPIEIRSSCTPLYYAIRLNDQSIVDELTVRGARNIGIDFDPEVPFRLAMQDQDIKNRIDIIELLLEYQASTSIRDSSGNSAMSYACQFPLDEIMKSCDDFRCGSHYRSKVLEEVATRQKIIIDMFLKYGADIHHCDDAYKFTLHMIIDKIGDHDAYPMKKNLVEFFLERGTDVNAVNGAGLTLLHVAIERSMTDYSHATLVDLLLKYRADVNAKSSDGKLNTPLHHAAELFSKPYHMKVIIMLLRELDIDLNSQNSDGETALHIATKRHLSLLISKLLRHGADISVENVNGDTPFSFLYDWVRENPEEFRPGVDETFASSYRFLDNGSLVFRCIVHMKRLIKLKSHMSKKAESYLEKLFPHRPEGAPEIDGKIDQQVELMKQTRIDSFTSLYDILLKDPTEIVIHLKNENFKKMILSSKFKTKFSRFHVMLTLQYELALARSTMLEDAKKTLNILFKCDWPDSCSEHVLMYLTNADLRKMIELEPNKRIRKRRLGEDLLELDSMIFPKVIKVEPQIEPEIEPEIEPGIELVTIED